MMCHAHSRQRSLRHLNLSYVLAVTSDMPSDQSTKLLPQKLRRNERERKRVDQVNQGFNQLRLRVPRPHGSKHKLSKVETLREATRYIEQLHALLQQSNYTTSTNQQQRTHVQQQTYYHHSSADVSPYYPTHFKQDCSPTSSYYSDSSFEEQKYTQFMR
ncbi:Helix-loop-helix DNA-binding domain protein [Dictyocaulus viviparus]|uniref:Helix-loop-helix DNA-binding domain protein n=1 Tax=Dictyocaulus viviparus TaxID=29172 RepID=A0A0D8XDN6_DICVI|nr:Helix-loop-helix DNA-binding domain protein [Dictyocaulus viviparus]